MTTICGFDVTLTLPNQSIEAINATIDENIVSGDYDVVYALEELKLRKEEEGR